MDTYWKSGREGALKSSLKSEVISYLYETWVHFCPSWCSFSFNVKNSLLKNYSYFSLRRSVKHPAVGSLCPKSVVLWIVSIFVVILLFVSLLCRQTFITELQVIANFILWKTSWHHQQRSGHHSMSPSPLFLTISRSVELGEEALSVSVNTP